MARSAPTLGEALDRAGSRSHGGQPLSPIEPQPERPLPVEIDAIDIGGRLRQVDRETVERLVRSIRDNEDRLETPVLLRPGRKTADGGDEGREETGRFTLIAGAHRLEAAKTLGWKRIPAFVRDVSPDQALIMEIDENLVRSELTALDRAVCIGKRKEVHERLHPRAGHGGDRKSGAFKNQDENFSSCSFTRNAAGVFNLSERAIQRAVRICNGLHPATIKLIEGTSLAGKENDLYRLAGIEDAEAQRQSARRILKHRRDETGRKRRRGPPPDGGYERLVDAWYKASSGARAKFAGKFIKAAGGSGGV